MRRENVERIAGLILLVSTIGVYGYLPYCGFVYFDDPHYVTENIPVHSGFSRAGVSWAFTTFHASNWHPLTWLSHMLDVQLYGLNPAGHHLTNLFFHLGNTLLLFLFLSEATQQRWRSFLVAALFSLHPLHVESVAWVSERKDVLSTFFWMLALVAYGRYARQAGSGRYLAVLLLYALGLMAKPMVVTLPLVLMLMDYWPLRRTVAPPDGPIFHGGRQIEKWSGLIGEKVPFFVLSAASSVVTLIAQSELGAVRSLEGIPFGIRVANALVSYVRYLFGMLWPHDLSIFYPHPGNALQPWLVVVCTLLLMGLSAALFYLAPRRPYLGVGWLWYLLTLLPVIGLVQVGDQAMADRYTYIPLVGVFIAGVWGVADLFAGCRVRRLFAVAFACAVFLALIVATRSQLRHWRNTETLFKQALRVHENNYLAHFVLAQVEEMAGRTEQAVFHKNKAAAINPAFVAGMYNRYGCDLAGQGQLDEAIHIFSEAIRIRPDDATAHNDLGLALARKAQFDQAIEHFTEALRISPGDLKVRQNLINVQVDRERLRMSISP